MEVIGSELASGTKENYISNFEKTKFIAPDVIEIDYQLQCIDDDKFLTLLASDGSIRTDVRLNPNFAISKQIEVLFKVSEGFFTSLYLSHR